MSKIPYLFETPIPKYFREQGWFNNENIFKFVVWAFSKCSPEPRKIVMQGKEITLAPFEFIAGRLSSPKECFLTEKQFRGPTVFLQKSGILKKTANSKANKYSCYVWVVERFTDKGEDEKGQQKVQQRANRGPTEGHNLDDKKIRIKEDHPSIPSGRSDRTTDDFSSKIAICPGVLLTQEELDACVKLKGDLEKVKQAIEFIQGSKRRKCEITDWPNALARWKIENKAKVRIEDNTALAEKLSKQFETFEDGHGWRCYLYNDQKRDQRGLLFESHSPYKDAVFIALIDGEFKKKCEEAIRINGMEKKGN